MQHPSLHVRVAAARTGAQQHQLAHELRMAPCQVERLKATQREAQYVDLLQAQRTDEGRGVVGHVLDACTRCAARGGDAATVVEDDFAPCREAIRHQRIPVVHAPAEVLQEQHRWLRSSAVAPATIGESSTADVREARGRGQMCVSHVLASECRRPASRVGMLKFRPRVQFARKAKALGTKSSSYWKTPPWPASG